MSANFPASRKGREKRGTRRELRIPFATATPCHPEAPSFGAEGSMQAAGATGAVGKSIDPSARKERGPQDDKRRGTCASALQEVPGFFVLLVLGVLAVRG
jgi:hypothetical protein